MLLVSASSCISAGWTGGESVFRVACAGLLGSGPRPVRELVESREAGRAGTGSEVHAGRGTGTVSIET